MSTIPHFESGAPLAVSQVDAITWETTARLIFHGGDRTVEVPIGARTDWASRPRITAWLIEKMIAAPATVVHDYCWRVLCPAGQMTYREADHLFEEMLIALDREAARLGRRSDRIPAPVRWLMWDAVRLASVTTKTGGWAGARADLPRMAAITIPGLVLAAPAAALLPSMGVLALVDRIVTRRGIDHPTPDRTEESM